MARVVDCQFLRFSCGHDLFNATYTRSNRTKGTKIMRCFPHCCPEHMPRCYCGCSLQVLVTFDDVDAVRPDELLVCARFETSEQQEPRHRVHIGSALTIPKALLSTNPDDANATAWVLAEKESDLKQSQVAKNSVLYVMNNHRFPRWYYSYESGATKNQREMRHHLTVYVLQRTRHSSSSRDNDIERVQVIGRQASPAFKLVSYRRARGEVKKPVIPEQDDPLAALEDQGALSTSDEDDGTASVSTQETPTKTPPPLPRKDSKAIDTDSGSESPVSRTSETRVPDVAVYSLAKDLARRRANSSPFVVVNTRTEQLRLSESSRRSSFSDDVPMQEVDSDEDSKPAAPRKRKACSPAAKTLWWRQHSEDAQRVLHLHVLFVMLNRLSLHDVMFCLKDKSERLRKKWFETIATKQGRISSRLQELARLFCLSVFAEDASRPTGGVEYAHAETRAVIATCLDVLVEVVMSEAVTKLLEATWDSHQSEILESEHIRVLFLQFVRRLHGAIDATVRKRRHAALTATTSKSVPGVKPTTTAAPHVSAASLGLAGLVDDAMTAVFREKRLLALRRDMARALSDGTWAAESWYQVFVSQLRVAWVHFNERKASGINLLWQAVQKTSPPLWNGRWLLDASSFRVRRPGGWFHQQQNSAQEVQPLGSVVSWIVLLRQWMAVEFAMDGVTLSAASLLTGTKRARLKLVLDERQRVFKSFPDGLASTIGCGGGDRGTWLHGDYVGRSRDDSSELLCETYSIRQQHRAEILRMAIKASIWSAPDGARRCVVAIQLASATCESFTAEQLVSWPVAARHERLYAAAKWNVVADVEATYHDLK